MKLAERSRIDEKTSHYCSSRGAPMWWDVVAERKKMASRVEIIAISTKQDSL